MTDEEIKQSIVQLQADIHKQNILAGWWDGPLFLNDRVPEKLCLIHSEVSEAMEGHRKDLMDDKLPTRKMIEVELADALIRILDLGGALNLDIAGAVFEKRAYNAKRLDHKKEHRNAVGGKKY